MLGELLGARYRVIQILGSGGFGHTYIAEDMQRPGNPRCVLKHLTFSSNDPDMLTQVRRLFQAEAETLEKLGQHDQIPRLLAYFEENCEFYLVQEFIEGHPLSQELAEGVRFSEHQVTALLDDVLGILAYVHEQGVIHRDVKPDNLIRRQSDRKLVLIDFGAVKTLGSTLLESQSETSPVSIPIYTSGYGASEQCLGRPRYSSDIYSLGMVGIQALTGMRPSQLPHEFTTCEVIWRDQVEVSEPLARVLNHMVRYHVTDRYPTAIAALTDLRQTLGNASPTTIPFNAEATVIPSQETQAQSPSSIAASALSTPEGPPSSPRPTPWAWSGIAWKIAGGLGLATLTGGLLERSGHLEWLKAKSPTPVPTELAITNYASITEKISAGERLLNIWQPPVAAKQDGIDALGVGNYPQAIANLETAHKQDPSDPETLIYLNNARIGKAPSYQTAIAVPFGSNVVQALELLRGTAQAQDEVNRTGGVNGVKLKVVIADDDNTPAIAQQIASTFVANASILGVIGHSNSDTTLAAAQIYRDHQLVMISPTSSAVKLSNFDRYIFRTIPNDRMTAQSLVNHMLQRLKKRKAAVYFNAASEYSQSLKQEFKSALFYNNIELIQEVDLTRPDFDADTSFQQAVAKGIEVILLAPDSHAIDRALQVIQLNQKQLQLLAGDTLYTPTVLKLAGEQALGMVVAVPAAMAPSPFQQRFTKLWGTSELNSWRTALAYDATQALVAALRKNPTRQGLQRSLSQPTFTASGFQGAVRFLPSGDRKGSVQLMSITRNPRLKPSLPKQPQTSPQSKYRFSRLP